MSENVSYTAYLDEMNSLFAENMASRPTKWVVSGKLGKKITADGRMNAFYGTTSVIKLSEADIARCLDIRNRIYGALPDMFVELAPETYHMTIHAFSNEYSVSSDRALIDADIARVEGQIREQFTDIASMYDNEKLRMRALGTSTNGKDVISIKLVPASVHDYLLLMDLYERFERIYPSGQFFVPHISLGYFKLQEYGAEQIHTLYSTLEAVNSACPLDIELSIDDLYYQRHYDMNDFRDIFGVRDFVVASS